MKKKLIGVASILLFLIGIDIVKAERFQIGNYITSTYVKMIEGDNTKYLTVQFIKSTNNEITYCIEPFILLDEQIDYQEMNEEELNLTQEDIIKIKLISYYGYGYQDRTEDRWYAYTQVLIWQTVSKNADIYFTNTLNGNKTNKFDTYMNQIMEDVNRDMQILNIQKEYKINLGSELIINNIPEEYTIKTQYHQYNRIDNSIKISSIKKNDTLTIQKINNYYETPAKFYKGNTSQKVLKRGNANGILYTSNIICLQGILNTEIQDKYNVIDEDIVIRYQIKTINNTYNDYIKKDPKNYKLPYGNIYIKAEILNENYLLEQTEYETIIDDNHKVQTIYLIPKKKKTKLKINDYICLEEECQINKNIPIIILDNNMNIIKEEITNEEGYIEIELPLGIYYIYQETIEGYEKVDSIQIEINDLEKEYEENIYNKKIIIKEEPIIIEDIEIEPPYTGIEDLKVLLIISIFTLINIKVVKKL